MRIRLVAAVPLPDIVMILLSSFIFGLVFGSFLNVVVYRLKTPPRRGGTTKDIIFGRSFCPKCKTTLKWHDLAPLLSFVLLKGQCRYCHKKISWQYPLVELLSGLIWVGVFYKVSSFQPPLIPPLIKGGLGGVFNVPLWDFFYYIFIISALLVIAVYDFKWRIIPDKIVYPAIAIALVYNIFPLDKGGLWGVLLTAAAAFIFFFLIYYFSKGRAMGLGDAKLAFLIGLFLSPLLAIAAFILSFVIGAVFGIILIGLGKIFPDYKKWGMKSQIAFGPFLVLGVAIIFFFSDFINNFLKF